MGLRVASSGASSGRRRCRRWGGAPILGALAIGAALAGVVAGVDSDGDGVPDTEDNCPGVANPDQLDGDFGIFGPPRLIGVRNDHDGARSVRGADLDGDGDPDALVASYNDGKVTWYENTDGRGSFGPARVIGTGLFRPELALASDLDGDGDLDVLVSANGDDEVLWFENVTGAGAFGPALLIASGFELEWIVAADLDGDGDTDVAAAIDHGITWYENLNGLGQFGSSHEALAAEHTPTRVDASDLDGDGDEDLVLSDYHDDRVAWLENLDGLGQFAPAFVIEDAVDGPLSLSTGDLDGDGDTDVLTGATRDDSISWYENDGTGTAWTRHLIDNQGDPISLVAVDLDGDHHLDALVGDGNRDRVIWYRNTDGQGDFGPLRIISTEVDGVFSVATADVDGDQAPEVLSASNSSDEVAWHDGSDLEGDACDNCPDVANSGQDDSDGDGLGDDCDNCPDVQNADQADADGDGLGDLCDPCTDTDGDGRGDPGFELNTCPIDSCPDDFDPVDRDEDGDGIGDVCDPCTDTDGDGSGDPGFPVNDCPVDNCPATPNPDQANQDGDGFGDACDVCVLDPDDDADEDGWCGDVDNCREHYNPGQFDDDGDGIGTRCDNCRVVPNPLQEDFDGTPVFEPTPIGFVQGVASVQAVDLSGDGRLDVLTASTEDATVAWKTGLPDGRFGPQSSITTEAVGASAATAADVDGDGDQDVLLTAAAIDTVAWFRNDGTGGFSEMLPIATDAEGASAIAVGDIDGDGDLDVTVAAASGDRVDWYENLDGDGQFSAARPLADSAVGAAAIFLGDLDGDGDPDALVASAGDDTIAWFRNSDGEGSFESGQILSETTVQASSVFAADLDGDGDMDALSAGQAEGEVAWYENLDGLGGFGPAQPLPGGLCGARSVMAVDADRDGDLDVFAGGNLIGTCTADGVRWFENLDGAGSFESRLVSPRGAVTIHAVDLDGDSDTDVLAGEASGRINWHESLGDGVGDACDNCPDVHNTRQLDKDQDGSGDECDECTDEDGDGFANPGFPASTCGVDNCALIPNPDQSDLDGDGLGDPCDICPEDTFNDLDDDGICRAIDNCPWHANADQSDTDEDGVGDACDNCSDVANPSQEDFDTTGSFGPPHRVPEAFSVIEAVAADIDGDGDLDVVSGSALGDVVTWNENTDGAGTLGLPRLISDEVDFVTSVLTADVDGDGDPDVLTKSFWDGLVTWYENLDGLGNFGPQRRVATAGPNGWKMAAADLDGDGDLDCVVANRWYENTDGLGNFGPGRSIGSDSVWFATLAADLDGDGDQDVISTSGPGASISWYENLDGDADFGPQRVLLRASGHLLAEDLDGDGDIDIVVGTGDNPNPFGPVPLIVGFENVDGQGNFRLEIIAETGGQSPVGAADMDGDGDLDLLGVGSEIGTVAWYENLGAPLRFGPPRVIDDDSGDLRTVLGADLTGDGRPDVLTASFAHHRLAWHENGPDGVGDVCDNCPATDNLDQVDSDADTLGDACDNCPVDANLDQQDDDLDTVGNACDNCPGAANTDQADLDADGDGDVCDACTDTDDDGFGNPGFPSPECNDDNCPDTPNADQQDGDADGLGDVCDNCPLVDNPGQQNTDGDPLGNACDNCPLASNLDQADAEQDGVGDACDNCPATPNADQQNSDGDPFGDACDNCPETTSQNRDDFDGDSLGDVCDNCPADENVDQADTDEDDLGDVCDPCTDSDQDGFGNPGFANDDCEDDNCPDTANELQGDMDMDGVGDACDNCPDSSNALQRNADRDPLGDACDNCAFTTNPAQTDSDDDDQGDVCDTDDGLIFVRFDHPDLIWPEEVGFDAWNAYAGDLEVLLTTGIYTQAPGSNDLAEQSCGLALPVLVAPVDPGASRIAFYLVSGIAAGVESDLGAASSGALRPNDSPCP